MNASTSTFPRVSIVEAPKADSATRHSKLLAWIFLAFVAGAVALMLYGADYYRLSQPERALSPKHQLLKPGGVVGIKLGLVGAVMLFGIFLYPLRKRWQWLQRRGNSKHWLDHHVALGVAGPICIALHSSFKFRGLAGLAFWLMVAVSLSGLIGRYLYAQLLQDIAAAHALLCESQAKLQRQSFIAQPQLPHLLPTLPEPGRVRRWSPITATLYMLWSEVTRPFWVIRLRARTLGRDSVLSIFGVGARRDIAFEEVIRLVRQHALLSRRILLLSQAKKIFQLWHVVHKPFSYAFGILVVLHIGIATVLGFF